MDGEREPLPSRVEDTAPLPQAYHRTVDQGLAALGLADLPATARAAIDGHIRLLLAWTEAINLTAIREPVAAASAHVLDALTAVPLLRQRGTDRFLDLGSGGGVPGMPLAAALPAEDALLVEPIGKKARFLATAIEAVGLDGGRDPAGRVRRGTRRSAVRVAATRAETLAADPQHRGQWPVVTARAVAPLPDLVELALPLLAPGGALLAWKRGVIEEEVAAAHRALAALGGGRIEDHPIPGGLPTGLAGHRLVLVTRGGVVPSGYPRDPAARKRRPW